MQYSNKSWTVMLMSKFLNLESQMKITIQFSRWISNTIFIFWDSKFSFGIYLSKLNSLTFINIISIRANYVQQNTSKIISLTLYIITKWLYHEIFSVWQHQGPGMAAGAVSLGISHDIVISSFFNIVKGQANCNWVETYVNICT